MLQVSHQKDKKISILTPTKVQDSEGFETLKYAPMPGGENIWAYFRHATQKEFYAAAADNTRVEVIFEINWRNDMKSNMQILYKGVKYSITNIDNFEGYKTDLRIYAYAINP